MWTKEIWNDHRTLDGRSKHETGINLIIINGWAASESPKQPWSIIGLTLHRHMEARRESLPLVFFFSYLLSLVLHTPIHLSTQNSCKYFRRRARWMEEEPVFFVFLTHLLIGTDWPMSRQRRLNPESNHPFQLISIFFVVFFSYYLSLQNAT